MRQALAMGLVIALAIGGWAWWNDRPATASGIDLSDPGMLEQGQTVYAEQCAACHGKNLEGQVPDWRSRLPDGSIPAPPHDETGHTWHHPDEMLFEITKLGRLKASGGAATSNMPGFGDKLSDAEIWAVLSYIKSRWPTPVQQRHDELNRRTQRQ